MSAFDPATLMLAAIAIPLIAALIIPVFARQPNAREAVTLIAAAILFVLVLSIAVPVLGGARPTWPGIEVLPGVSFAFSIEPLGMLFALIASGLWIVNSVYSIGYMRTNDEPRQTGYYVCFAIALGSTMGIAFSANLFTLFLFYEALTLSTFPLVTHHRDEKSIRSGRLYLLMLLGTSLLLFLPAIVITFVLAGTVDFKAGGILAGTGGTLLAVLLGLYAFGIGKAAVMPLHAWLPAAMVAPTPVSALLHAVAVVKAGVFSVLKVVVYIFGIDTLASTGASTWLVYVASASILLASLIALSKDNLKARLAYSTVSQLGYVVLGAALASANGVMGGAVHIAMHAAGKITLFFCAGAIYTAAHKTEISDMNGLGRTMPVTMFAFFLAALSIIGLPPMGGTWSKWFLIMGALDTGHLFVVGVLMLSSALNVGYLLSIVGRAFFLPPPNPAKGIHEAPLACLVPLCITALLCIVLFFQIDVIESMMSPVAAGR